MTVVRAILTPIASFRLLAACVLLATTAMPSPAAQLKPFDHATRDQNLVDYRSRLIAAVEARDFDELRIFLSSDIQLSFGGHSGLAETEKFFSEQPELWDKLRTLLRRGGGFQGLDETDDRIFVAPYTFFAEPPPGLDVFEFVVVTGEGVAARAKGTTDSAVLARYSYEILPVDMMAESNDQWQGVKLPDGRTGYISQRYVASPVDHRAGFRKIDGQWKMIFFLAGD